MISSFVRALISAFKARRELALENVALRQQLAVLPRWYCQVEAFRADPTPRYWQRRALKPHHLAARFELETST